MIIRPSFVKFLGVGATAFWVHILLVYFLVQGLGLWEMPSCAISFVLVMTGTWMGNRRLTFQVQTPPTWQEYFRYVRGTAVGGLINMVVFTIIISLVPPIPTRLLIGAAGGTLAGLAWNYKFMHTLWVKGPKKS